MLRVTPGGNADGCERKGLAGKAICKTMKTKGHKVARLVIRDTRFMNGKSGDTPTPGVCRKSLQAIEKETMGCKKEGQERKRVRKPLKRTE